MTPPKPILSAPRTSSFPLTSGDDVQVPAQATELPPPQEQYISNVSPGEWERLKTRKPDDTPGGLYLHRKTAPFAKGRTVCIGVGVNNRTNHDLTIAIRGGKLIKDKDGYQVCTIPDSNKTIPGIGTVTPAELAHAEKLGGHIADTVKKKP